MSDFTKDNIMDEFITDDELCNAIGLEIKEFQKIVDWLLLKKYNITGVVRVIKSEQTKQIAERKDAIYTHEYNNINPKVVWAWSVDVAEDIAQKILGYKKLYPTLFSCE